MAPLTLTRLTTEYSVEEDRLCLRGEDETGRTVIIWLTARMLRVLTPRLTGWLERQTANQPLADVRQTMAQEAAVASHAAQPPVAAALDGNAFLTRSIDIITADDAMRLVFKAQDGSAGATDTALAAEIPFLAEELRQWLAIVMAASDTAGWPSDIWPDWMREARRPAQAAPRLKLH